MLINFFTVFKKSWILLAIILIGGFIVRQYRIDNAIADWHSWRQADTASVARNFYQEGFNPFLPKGDDMSPISENGQPNLGRYRFVEFPIYNTLVYVGYILNGGVNVRIAREVTVFISLISVIFIYLITRRSFNEVTAVLAAAFFAFLPYNIYYSRVVLPDPLLIMFSLGMFYFIDRFINEKTRKFMILSIIFAAGAFLTKPEAAFYLLPLLVLFYKKEGKLFPIDRRYIIMAVLAVLPFAAWRIWMLQHPEGIPAADWLLNGNGIRFRPAFWRWILVDRFGREILTVTGTVLFFIGLLIAPREKENNMLHLLAIASFLYLIVFATGNVQHDYYQIFIVPAIVIFLARGVVLMFEGVRSLVPRIFTIPFAILFISLTFYLGWPEAKGLFQINNDAVTRAGDAANAILPKNATVLAPYDGDTSLLYNTNRHGFPVTITNIPDMISRFGVGYYVSITKDPDTAKIMHDYTVMENNQYFVIVDLTKPASASQSADLKGS